MHQDCHAVFVLCIDSCGVLKDELIQTVVVTVFGSKHHGRQSLAILDQHLLFRSNLVKDGFKNVFFLVTNS